MGISRVLTSGVDVWLNTPVHPYEASGTSGMKAAINGTVNLSVLDGWWAEAYDGRREFKNGWGIPPSFDEQGAADRDRQDSTTLYETLQDEVLPLYYGRDGERGYSPGWVQLCKRSMASVLPAFNSERVLRDYVRAFYAPAARQGRIAVADDFRVARDFGAWKSRVHVAWPGVALKLVGSVPTEIAFGRHAALEVDVTLNGLLPDDVRVECVVRRILGSELVVPVQGYSDTGRPEHGAFYVDGQRKPARAVRAWRRRRRGRVSLPARDATALGRELGIRDPRRAAASESVAPVRARVVAKALSGRKTKPVVTKVVLRTGSRLPLGATAKPDGVNFAIYGKNATRMWLRLYRGALDAEPIAEFELDPRRHRTYDFWHAFVSGAKAGWYYTWRADGPKEPAAGIEFEPRRELLDPWARLVSDATWRRAEAVAGSIEPHVRAQIAAQDDYDWEGDEPLRRPLAESVIYELHVRGFTRHPSSGVTHPGTFRGLIEKIPYLKSLGVTDVELLPIFAFDRQDVPPAGAALGLSNYWGYSPLAFFAPHSPYAADEDPRREFRDLVKALHAAGIGVILDVVLNHTAEGDADGPTFGFKGLVNDIFYILDPQNKSRYFDFTGCGNTVNCNHPLVAQYLLECLTFWAREMHVDGFRLDLASVLSRGEDGKPLAHSPVLASIEFAEALGNVHLIAEAWDAGGLYQVGSFPGFRWAEWNGPYRDAIRRFVRGEPGLLGEIATRIAGSSDLYGPANKTPQNSINFVTCHDGFTLYDLVSYDRKHNERERRGEPRRPRRQPQLELRRRGRHRRPRRAAAAHAASTQFHGAAAVEPRRADVRRRR